jgi:DNA-binding SARP family transcriptional activator
VDGSEKQQMIVNAALVGDFSQPEFVDAALARAIAAGSACVVTDDPNTLPQTPDRLRRGFDQVALDSVPMDPEEVFVRMRQHIAESAPVSGLIVDMGWIVGNLQGVTGMESWGGVADRLAESFGIPVVSLYNQDLTIEEQLQAALRAHRQFLAPSGLYDNPYWIPAALLESAPLDEQLSFMLGRVVPDYAGLLSRRQAGQMFARGTTPSWLAPPRAVLASPPGAARWHVHCLGQLRVFIGNRQVDWRLPGGAPKKTRTLFAYLLQSGEKGAHADQIGELLWPEGGSEETKRARLHHTVAMLRKTLGDAGAVLRNGEYYRLNAPPGSWIDIDTFEQLCRRGLSLFKRAELAAAFRVYAAADQLHHGDLFEDLPIEYVRSETDDWCMPRRIWLREMAVKLQYDFAKVCMRLDRTREALDHCQKALSIDPTSEGANAEAMKIFVAQGRMDAMHRQYRQYRAALVAIGASEGTEIRTLYRELARSS